MDQNQNHSCLWCRGNASKAFVAVAAMLGLFLLALTIKEFKSIPYVGKEVAAVNTITVSGTADAYATPDIATFSFTLTQESPTVSAAQDEVNKKSAAIVAFLKKSGVAEKDIKTLAFNIYPRYEYPRVPCPPSQICPANDRVLVGYEVSQMIEVKVRTLANAGTIVSGVGSMGVSDIGSLSFTVDKEDTVKREAREKAISDAKKKANELASDLGVHLVRIVQFSDSSGGQPIYYAKADMMAAGSASASREATLPSGENKYTSNVNITYEIR
jgi:hypothetical protein